ncbi:Auxin-responsive protein SAUR32 [Hibiscus syriacus]|uniref:Auxin-responsive protein SAUR32 n=1 Tax=Hibiscus syriacus TaxID=106335 RepID=A0A6A2Y8W8_HIBSY|nr:auxin-responsive protein SAUR36-like [Hibiscus syriacus]KAE8670239.1 Auxin-responsive protein SAUR32 [Hibiscus syriacus]
MKKIRGFKLVKVFKWIIRPGSRNFGDGSLGHQTTTGSYNPFSKIRSFTRFLRCWLCDSNSDSGYIRLGEEGTESWVPKGHLAVYVGESERDTTRVVVPVIYLNHPLFGELLKDSERVYGFDQSGGIALPCGISEFEKVKKRIADCRRRTHRRC